MHTSAPTGETYSYEMPGDAPRSTLMRAAWVGSLLALAVDVLMLSGGHLSLWRQMGLLGSFYEVQGHALLHGHLAVPTGSVSFEGFVVGGRTYTYFGLFPALLRFPILLFTHGLDGRLTQLSLLLALVVMLWAGAQLHWRVRELIRPDEPVTRREQFVVGLLALALGAGGVPLFLASWPVIYHEAALWGAALSLAAVNAVLAVAQRPSTARIVAAIALALLAVNTRVSTGLGPIVALGLVAVAQLVRGSSEAQPRRARRTAAALALGALLALGSAALVNEARFHSAFSIPLSKQVDTSIDPNQRAFLAANHGSTVGPQFVPTTLLAAVRPDALGLTRAFPFIGLPESPPTVIGSVRFNALLPSLSAFTSMPLFCLLLLAGVPVFRRRRRIGPLIAVLAGTATAFVPALSFGSTATRYLSDLLPFLFIGACTGLQTLLGHPRWRKAILSRAGLAAIFVLVLAGILINGAVGLVQQNLLAAGASASQRASFVRDQDDIDRFLGRSPHGVHAGTTLPSRALGPLGDLFVLDRCAGLYVQSFGGTWLPVERSSGSGLYELRVQFPARAPQAAAALLTLGRGSGRVTVLATGAGARVVFSVRVSGHPVASSSPVAVGTERPTLLSASIDPLIDHWFLTVQIAGHPPFVHAEVPYDRHAIETAGADPSDPALARFAGTVVPVPEHTPVCHRVATRAGLL